MALRGRFEVKLCGGQAEILPAPPAYPNDLPSVYWEKGWKHYKYQAQEKVVKMGQAGRTSQEVIKIPLIALVERRCCGRGRSASDRSRVSDVSRASKRRDLTNFKPISVFLGISQRFPEKSTPLLAREPVM